MGYSAEKPLPIPCLDEKFLHGATAGSESNLQSPPAPRDYEDEVPSMVPQRKQDSTLKFG